MRRILFSFVLQVGLMFSACNRIAPQTGYPAPPSTSYRIESVEVVVDGTPYKSVVAFVTPQFNRVAGARPLIGRYFADEEYQKTSALSAVSSSVAVLTHDFWQHYFKSDPVIIGKTLALNGKAYTVVGVMPEGFHPPEKTEVLVPGAAP
jgi:putative ABC transport system permease protein